MDYINSLGISQLDLVILTHPDSDHLGGIVDVLNSIPVKKVVTNGQPHTTTLYESFLDVIANTAIEYSEVKRGVKLSYGDITIDFLNPVSIQDNNLNNNSLVFRVVYGTISFLFTGDLQSDGEAQLLSSNIPLSSTILKVAHHGSQTGSTPAFLEAVHPVVAIYTAGLGNASGYPSQGILDNLAALKANIYGTDQNGTIIISTDGTDYAVETEKVSTRSGSIIPVEPNSSPTISPTITDTITPTITDTIEPTSTEMPGLSISLVSLTNPIPPGGQARMSITTTPGANCAITVIFKSVSSQAAGLGPQAAGSDGSCSWSWKIGSRTTEGMWKIVISVSLNGQSLSQEFPFEVKK